MTATTTNNKRSKRFDNLVGPTDPKIDYDARDRLVTARIGLLLKHSFFGNLATRLKLVNADSWCGTAATDGRNFYYNSRFIMTLKTKEVEFLFGHEVLHVIYDHMGRRGNRDPKIWNIANDFAVNADLKKHNVGEMIPEGLYDSKYIDWTSEDIYEDINKNVKRISMDELLDRMIDEHLEENEFGDDDDEGNGEGGGKGKGRPRLTNAEREEIKREFREAILSAAQQADGGSIPLGVARLIKEITDPVMPWRELIQTNLTSAIKSDYSWMRPSRRSQHLDAIMPGQNPGEEIDVTVMIDMSGSISNEQGMQFLSEVAGMMEIFDGFKIHVACFDTQVYNPCDFTSENLDTIDDYELAGGGGTDFDCFFGYLKDEGIVPNRLIVFTDGYPCGSWGDPEYCDTTWIIHGDPNPNPPFGQYAIYDDHRKG